MSDRDLVGKTIVLTGTFAGLSQAAAKEALVARGARVVSSLSGRTDLLIAGHRAGSKVARAEELGVRVVGESYLAAALADASGGQAPFEEPSSDEQLRPDAMLGESRENTQGRGTRFEGKTVVVTGKFQQLSRNEVEAQLRGFGATVRGSVSKNTEILIAGDNAGSKLAKAMQLGILVLGERELLASLSDGGSDEMLDISFDHTSVEDFCAAVDAVCWKDAPAETIDALHAALCARQARSGVDDAHLHAAKTLAAAGIAQVGTHVPHDTDLVAWAISSDGAHFATGGWVGDNYEAGGALAIWEVDTGACVNVFRVEGGVGWPDYGRSIQWCGEQVGLTLNGSGVGVLEAFGVREAIPVYGAAGVARPMPWCWAPDGVRVFIALNDDSEPGCVAVPSTPSVAPVAIASAHGEAHEPLSEMAWTADGRVVGSTDYGTAYAIDTNTREFLWRASLASPCALHPRGTRMVGGSERMRLIDTETGQECDVEVQPPARAYFYSPDGAWIATVGSDGSVRVLDANTLEEHSVLPFACDVNRPRTPADLRPLAWDPSSARIVGITKERKLVVWSVAEPATAQTIGEAPPCSGVFFGGNDIVVVAGKHRLLFVRATDGAVVAERLLFELPTEDPEETILPFPDGGKWGYVGTDFVVSENDPEDHVHLRIGRRHSWPFSWLAPTRYSTVAAAVAAQPKSFPPSVRARYEKNKPRKSRRKKLPFSLEDDLTERDLLDYALCGLRDPVRPSYLATRHLSEIAVQLTLQGRFDDADVVLGNSGQTLEEAAPVAHAAAYFAREGRGDLAAKYVERAKSAASGHTNNGEYYPTAAAWIAATERMLGNAGEPWLAEAKRWADAIDDDLSDGRRRIAVALAFAGEWKLALAYSDRPRDELVWLAGEACRASNQIDRLEQVLNLGRLSHDSADLAIRGCIEAGLPNEAFKLRDYMKRSLLSFSGYLPAISEAIAHRHGPAAAAEIVLEEYGDSPFLGTRAALLRSLVRFAPDVAEERVASLLDDGILHDQEARSFPELLGAMSEVLAKTGRRPALRELLSSPKTWSARMVALRYLSPEDDVFSSLLRDAIEEADAAKPGRHWELLQAVSAYDAIYADQFARVLDAAGRDRRQLEEVMKIVAGLGDFEGANTVRMKLSKSQRSMSNRVLAAEALRRKHVSCAIAMLETLPRGWGSSQREYEVMRGLVRSFGDGVERMS